ncbi:uncharacterized protein LOC113449626 [Pseudonaja textilis]|uniref:uncharacterized protein LOC113449626 n=1 Tax=Pseudonaja textilis TaxID=8673 RepID=UPI000EA91050|nr:uncharacterized protein LOC113449626 [Pseudonaja textilis]
MDRWRRGSGGSLAAAAATAPAAARLPLQTRERSPALLPLPLSKPGKHGYSGRSSRPSPANPGSSALGYRWREGRGTCNTPPLPPHTRAPPSSPSGAAAARLPQRRTEVAPISCENREERVVVVVVVWAAPGHPQGQHVTPPRFSRLPLGAKRVASVWVGSVPRPKWGGEWDGGGESCASPSPVLVSLRLKRGWEGGEQVCGESVGRGRGGALRVSEVARPLARRN